MRDPKERSVVLYSHIEYRLDGGGRLRPDVKRGGKEKVSRFLSKFPILYPARARPQPDRRRITIRAGASRLDD